MIITNHEIRIASFYDVTRDIIYENAIYDFSDEEKAIYANIANAFMSVCPCVEPTTKHKDDIDLIPKSLNDLRGRERKVPEDVKCKNGPYT